MRHLFILFPQLFIHELPTIYPRKKKFGPTKYPSEKILGPQNTHEKKIRSHEGTMARDPLDPQRDESHGI